MGSGHVLVYAFDVLMEIYKESGYTERDAAGMIVRNNLFGLDIDERAAQMAYLAVMMKARQYDRRFLTRGIQPNVYAPGTYEDGQEYGSMLQVDALEPLSEADGTNLFGESADARLNTWNFRRLLAQKYDIVVTNPPYLNKYNPKLKDFVNKNYKDYSGDLFSVFIYRNLHLCKPDGYCGYMTPNVWMFIKTYEKLRNHIIKSKQIATLVQMAKGAFFKEATVDVCSFVIRNCLPHGTGLYLRLEDFKGDMEVQKTKVLEALADKDCGYFYEADQSNFSKIPGAPVAYWVSEKFMQVFQKGKKLNDYAVVFEGLKTRDKERFLRFWFEVNTFKWKHYAKGGAFRRWYGNGEYVVDWGNNGDEVRAFKKSSGANFKNYFTPTITYSALTSYKFSARFIDNQIFGGGGGGITKVTHLNYILAFINSCVFHYLINAISPTLNFEVGQIGMQPIIFDDYQKNDVQSR